MTNKKKVRMEKTLKNIETKGYGFIASSAMEDERLSLGAKALYAYFISKAGANHSCYPSNNTIQESLGIKSKITLNNYKYELEAYKYLKIVERKTKSGRLTSNHYYPAKLKLLKEENLNDDFE